MKGIQIGKNKVKLSLITYDMVLYTENCKDLTDKLLELICEFSKVTEYKVYTTKRLFFFNLTPIMNCQKDKLRKIIPHFYKELQRANKHIKRCSP